MSNESDGVMESLSGQLRMAMMVAAQIAERTARIREQLLRDRGGRDAPAGRQLAVRFENEQAAAGRALAGVHDSSWWEQADVPQVAAAYETAQAWRGSDELADQAAVKIAEEVRSRYGVNVDELGPQTRETLSAVVAAASEREAADRSRAQSEKDAQFAGVLLEQADGYQELAREAREREASFEGAPAFEVGADGDALRTLSSLGEQEAAREADRNEQLAEGAREGGLEMFDRANQGLHDADQADRRAATAEDRVGDLTGHSLVWDSPERRAALAQQLGGKGLPREGVDARLLADRVQATAPAAAVQSGPSKAPQATKAKAGRSRGAERELTR